MSLTGIFLFISVKNQYCKRRAYAEFNINYFDILIVVKEFCNFLIESFFRHGGNCFSFQRPFHPFG
jgi:hypothetical protein